MQGGHWEGRVSAGEGDREGMVCAVLELEGEGDARDSGGWEGGVGRGLGGEGERRKGLEWEGEYRRGLGGKGECRRGLGREDKRRRRLGEKGECRDHPHTHHTTHLLQHKIHLLTRISIRPHPHTGRF